MKQKPPFLSHPITRLAVVLLLVVVGLAPAHAATPTGTKIYPSISNTQSIELVGGSTEAVIWTAPAAGTYKLWVQVPATSTASTATYSIYPQGNAVGNSTCSGTDPSYPCFQVSFNQALPNNGWVQLVASNPAAASWTFTSTGFVSTNPGAISQSEQLGVGKLIYQSTVVPPPFTIGQSYQGGKIFYIDSSKQHGLIAAPVDQTYGITWRNGVVYITTGATGTAIGTGQNNTSTTIAAQGPGSYAAKLCDDLVLGGYTDWYLPSKDELNQLYLNRAVVGGFAKYFYWSSSENDHYNAWYQYFGDGSQTSNYKSSALAVRAIRSF